MKEPQWLLREVVLAVHERLLAEFGGSAGVRDLGLLESARARPGNLFAYKPATVCELAASYAFGIVKTPPPSLTATNAPASLRPSCSLR